MFILSKNLKNIFSIESDPFDLTFDLEAQGFPGGDPQKMQK